MKLKLEYKRYSRRFRRPLETAHGEWTDRSGFLVRLTDAEGRHGYGEVAPAPWLGSETVAEAGEFLRAMSGGGAAAGPVAIGRLPACRFALDAARDELRPEGAREIPVRRIEVAALLPAGEGALAALRERAAAGFRTFKWKIGVREAAEERELYRALLETAPEGSRFRLDANGGLTLPEAREWLGLLDEIGGEFLEQPLPPAQFDEMNLLATQFRTPVALDESVSDARRFEEAHRRGWKGLYVIKPAIFGAMREGEALLPPLRPRIIISSVFETSIGYESVLRWASRWQSENYAAGLGTSAAIEQDGLLRHPGGPHLIRGLADPARIWEVADGM